MSSRDRCMRTYRRSPTPSPRRCCRLLVAYTDNTITLVVSRTRSGFGDRIVARTTGETGEPGRGAASRLYLVRPVRLWNRPTISIAFIVVSCWFAAVDCVPLAIRPWLGARQTSAYHYMYVHHKHTNLLKVGRWPSFSPCIKLRVDWGS